MSVIKSVEFYIKSKINSNLIKCKSLGGAKKKIRFLKRLGFNGKVIKLTFFKGGSILADEVVLWKQFI